MPAEAGDDQQALGGNPGARHELTRSRRAEPRKRPGSDAISTRAAYAARLAGPDNSFVREMHSLCGRRLEEFHHAYMIRPQLLHSTNSPRFTSLAFCGVSSVLQTVQTRPSM